MSSDNPVGSVSPLDPSRTRRLKSKLHEPGKRGEPFTVNAAIRYLEDLEKRDAATFGLALTYIRKAPIEVQTPVRDAVKKRFP